MGFIRPATPGFLVTLAATGLLAVVTFSVPYIKSLYFLKASLSVENIDGSVTFGTLGYCMNLPNGTTCSKPHVGYELDVNALLGDDTSIQIPNVLVKWITYALVLHIVALILAALSTLFGLLAHVREMSMTYCSSFISGFAASVALVAFIFDLVLFFLTKKRIDDVSGGSASMGNAVWLTLASWILLFFAGCFYGLGRCCIRRRPSRYNDPSVDNGYAEQMRLDAVKAEADRKARQKQGEIGLPAFQELEQMQPLARTTDEEYIDDGDKVVPLSGAQKAGVGTYNRRQPSQTRQDYYPGGYAQGAVGQRAVDAYYNPNVNASPAAPAPNVYPPQSPPQARRQGSGHTQSTSAYTPSSYSHNAAGAGAGYGAYGHVQQPTNASAYGHTAGGSSYYNQAPAQQQPYPNFSLPRDAEYSAEQRPFNAGTYNATGYVPAVGASSSAAAAAAASTPYYAQTAQPDRSYTLGGDAYGAGRAAQAAYYDPYAASSPAPINTQMSPPARQATTTSPRGPRPPSQLVESPLEGISEMQHDYTDSPPMYDAATAQPPGQWGAKGH